MFPPSLQLSPIQAMHKFFRQEDRHTPMKNNNHKKFFEIFYMMNIVADQSAQIIPYFRRKGFKSFLLFLTKTFQKSFDATHTLIACIRENEQCPGCRASGHE